MPHVRANGLELYYESHGPEGGEPILLIMGLGAQMIAWPPELIGALTDKGFRVIAYDNRDVGLSEKLDAAGAPDLPAIVASLRDGHAPRVAYVLDDMADDAAGLLDALGVGKAHIVGASMGGMIAQLVAANHPDKTLSLTSIMSTTGNPELPRAKPEAMAFLNNRGPDPNEDLEGFLENAVASNRVMGSPGWPGDPEVIKANARRTFERCFYPVGFQRQYAAITASPDRRPKLAKVTASTVVIHGEADPLVPVEGGQDTAAAIPGAELVTIPGMGHDLPAGVHDKVVAGVLRAVERSKAEA